MLIKVYHHRTVFPTLEAELHLLSLPVFSVSFPIISPVLVFFSYLTLIVTFTRNEIRLRSWFVLFGYRFSNPSPSLMFSSHFLPTYNFLSVSISSLLLSHICDTIALIATDAGLCMDVF